MYLKTEEVLARNKNRNYGYDENKNIRALTDREFYDISCEMGSNQDNPQYRRLFDNFSRWIARTLGVNTGLEIGCGPGYLLYCLNKLGIDAHGTDGNPYSHEYFKSKHPALSHRYHLDPRLEKNYGQVDVLLSMEVFEHIEDEGLILVFRKIREQFKPKLIVFSSTPHPDLNPEWDQQWGHINIKPTAEWDDLFARNGFVASKMTVPFTEWSRLYVNKALVSEPKYCRLLKKQSWLSRKIAML